jgi:ferritin-like metal-binding protein YciE
MLLNKAMLDSSAFSPSTGSYFLLTADGKRTLEDMRVWKRRFGQLELNDFLIKLHDIRYELATTVNKALNITRDFQGFGYGYSIPDARAPSLMLAERGSTAARTVNLLNAKGDQIAPRGEKLMIASLLGEKEGVGTELVTRYRQLTAKANEMGMTATDDDFRSAALVGLPDEQVDQVLERVKQLKLTLNLNENDLTWLALSDHTVEQSETRYSSLLSGAQAMGMQEDAPLLTAMAIMAGSDLPENVVLERFDFLQGALQRNYRSPRVAAAMLAIGPLEPEEALFVLRESVGIISRASYFDDAEEVDNLALLLATTNSIMIPAAGNASVDQSRGSAITPGRAMLFLTPLMTGAFLYYWMNQNYHLPTIQRIATHPMHMHTVPYFG